MFVQMKTRKQELLEAMQGGAARRTAELREAGFNAEYLRYAVNRGLIRRVGHGLYSPIEPDAGDQHSVALVAKRCPAALFCLLSALRIHELGTQNPSQVWVALPARTWKPKLDFVKTRVVRFSPESYAFGVETREIEGVPVRVTSVAKTVADLFKYRNKIGVEVAVEALREAWRTHRCTMRDLAACAKTNRVERIMRPYLESLS